MISCAQLKCAPCRRGINSKTWRLRFFAAAQHSPRERRTRGGRAAGETALIQCRRPSTWQKKLTPEQVAEVGRRHVELGRLRLVVSPSGETDVMTLKAESRAQDAALAQAVGESLRALTKLGGAVELKIPAESTTGRKLRLRGRGLPGTPPGDQIVLLEVHAPPARGERQRELYREMAAAFSEPVAK